MGEHSKLMSPSSGKLWTVCTAMPQAIIDSGVVDKGGHAASRGEIQHHYAELIKLGEVAIDGPCPPDLDATEWYEVQTAVQMADESIPLSPSAKVYLEMQVRFPEPWRNDCFGTGDIMAVDVQAGMIHARDYKFGRVFVESEGNTQMMIYAIALIRMLIAKGFDATKRIHTVSIGVIQPKHKKSFKVWEIAVKDLIAWDDNILAPAQKEIVEGRGKFVTGSHCVDGYCKLRDRCPAAMQQTIQQMEEFKKTIDDSGVEYFNELDFHSPEIAKVLGYYYYTKNIVEAVYSSALEHARKGGKIDGFKLVAGTGGKRYWTDSDRADTYLAEIGCTERERYGEKLVGVAAAKKVAKEKKLFKESTFNSLFDWSSPSPKLVGDGAPGDEIEPDLVEREITADFLLDGIE